MIALRTLHVLATLVALLALGTARSESLGLDPRLEKAVATYRQEGAQRALPQFQRLVGAFSSTTAPRDHAATLHYIGECHWRLGNFTTAHQYLDRALTVERASKDRAGEARTLNVQGLLAWDEGQYDRAIARFTDVGPIARELGDRRLEGASLNNLSLVHDELGEYDTSLEQYARVLELYSSVDFPRGVGDTLGNIGGVHLLLGHFKEALGYYQQALAISERLKSTTSLSQDHGNVALCLLGLGDFAGALQHFDRAIELARQAGMRQDQAYWLRQKGNGLVHLGRYDEGLAAHRAAVGVYESIGARAERAEALHDLGRLHLLLGDPGTAEQYFNQSLALARATNLSRSVTLNLLALGDLKWRGRSLQAARLNYQQSLQRSTRTGEQQWQVESLLRLAQVDREQGRLEEATKGASRALAIALELAARPLEAEARLTVGDLQRRRGQLPEALQSFQAAEAALGADPDPDLLWRIHYGRGRTFEARGELRAAVDALLAAVTVIEGVRSRLQEPRFRAGFVDDKYDVYVDLVRLQLQLGRTAEAFTSAERLRARTYVEQLGGRSTLPLTDDERRREAQLLDRIRQLQHALAEQDDAGRPTYPRRALERFSAELQSAEQEYQAFLEDHAAPGRAAATPMDAAAGAGRVQQQLGADEALIEYVLGTDTLMAFVVTRSRLTARTIPLRRADLEARIALLRDLVQRPGDERWRKPAARLSADLVTPLIANDALPGIRRLYLVPHGVLNYLPFAVLPTGDAPTAALVVDRYAIAYLPAAVALLQAPKGAAPSGGLLAIAPARSRLRYASEEARSVEAMFEPNSRALVGTGATESEFKRVAGAYNMLHLATHGSFNKANPLLSGLELEADADNDGLLQVHEVLGLHLHADLVTLSACETALGSGYFSDQPAGDDFVGMTRAFLSAGSHSVVATLWDVDDRASVTLMTRFYQGLRHAGRPLTAADSLATAQRALRAAGPLSHPYYWAPFVAVGAMNPDDGRAEVAALETSP